MLTQRMTHILRSLVICVLAAVLPSAIRAQTAARAADSPSRNAETRVQADSLTVHFLRAPKSKPAALSVGGKTAAQSRKFSGKPDATSQHEPVETPLPVRARTTKP
jgi:hypothetical protein